MKVRIEEYEIYPACIIHETTEDDTGLNPILYDIPDERVTEIKRIEREYDEARTYLIDLIHKKKG